jgi:hypothetical protein
MCRLEIGHALVKTYGVVLAYLCMVSIKVDMYRRFASVRDMPFFCFQASLDRTQHTKPSRIISGHTICPSLLSSRPHHPEVDP